MPLLGFNPCCRKTEEWGVSDLATIRCIILCLLQLLLLEAATVATVGGYISLNGSNEEKGSVYSFLPELEEDNKPAKNSYMAFGNAEYF